MRALQVKPAKEQPWMLTELSFGIRSNVLVTTRFSEVHVSLLVPLMLPTTTHRDIGVELVREKYHSPCRVPPIGVQRISHLDRPYCIANPVS